MRRPDARCLHPFLLLLPTTLPPFPAPQVRTVGSMLRSNALRTTPGINVTFGSKSNEEKVSVA